MCDRSSDPTEHDAARERPSALDVSLRSLAKALEGLEGEPTMADVNAYALDADDPENARLNWYEWRAHRRHDMATAILARLTEPDAEATPNPDRVTIHDHVEWAHHVRSEHEATHSEPEMCGAGCAALGLIEFDDADPDTTEATLRAALTDDVIDNWPGGGGRVSSDADGRGFVHDSGGAWVVLYLPRAALQQPAVQPESRDTYNMWTDVPTPAVQLEGGPE